MSFFARLLLVVSLVGIAKIIFNIGYEVGFDKGVGYGKPDNQFDTSYLLSDSVIRIPSPTQISIMKQINFEIEDVSIEENKLHVIVLKNNLFSRDVVINKPEFEKWVCLRREGSKKYFPLFSYLYYRGSDFFSDLYDYIRTNNLVSDVVKFDS